MTLESIFAAASQKPQIERESYLNHACGDNAELRAKVERLLAAHDAAGSFLEPQTGAYESRADAEGVAGTVIAGRYTLVEPIGEGGMGEVWVAKQTEPVKRRVALKLIKAGMDSKAVLQRFEAERQALAMMDHPNIARVFDGGMTDERRPFFVMELVNGLPLNKFCDEAKLGIRARLDLFVAICQAIQHAHQKGIVHRDLKPSNILVTLIDSKPVPKVIDFGVAKAVGGKLTDESLSTGFGAVVGTLEYMSPEQAGFTGEDIDTRADIYSLGVILYELLTGLRPIDSQRLRKAALTEMIRIIQEDEPSKPSTRLSTAEALPSLAAVRQIEPKKLTALLRGELDWVVMKCLEKQRERRYETASGLARDIQRYIDDEPVEARPPSAGYRLQKFVRRHKGQVAAASLVLLALVAGIIGTTTGMVKAINAESREAVERAKAEHDRDEKEQARSQEALAKEKATAEADRANHVVANNHLILAQAAWNEGNVPRAFEWLEAVPEHERGWAWKFSRRLFDACLFKLFGHAANIMDAKYSPDGRKIATISADRTARIWDARTGRELLSLRGHNAPVTRLAWNHDGTRLATLDMDAALRVWDAANGRCVLDRPGETGGDFNIEFSRDGQRIAWSPSVNTVIWDFATNKELIRVPGAFCGFRPDMKAIATTVSDPKPTVKIWDAQTGQPIGSIAGPTETLVWSPDSSLLFTANMPINRRPDLSMRAANLNDRTLRKETILQVWDAKALTLLTPLEVTPGRSLNFAISPDGGRIAIVQPGELKIRTVRDGRLVASATLPHHVQMVAFRPDGLQVATSDGEAIQVWDAHTGKESHTYCALSGVGSLAYSPDGNQLVTFSDNLACVWSARTSAPARRLDCGPNQLNDVAFSPDGRQLAIGSGDYEAKQTCRLHVWDVASGRKLAALDRDNRSMRQVMFRPGSDQLAAADANNFDKSPATLTSWKMPAGQVLRSIDFIRRFAYNPRGSLLATTSSKNYQVAIRDADSGEIRQTLDLHKRLVTRVLFNDDGSRLLTASLDGTACLWDVETGKIIQKIATPEAEGISSASISADGRFIALGGTYMASIWDAQTAKLETKFVATRVVTLAPVAWIGFAPGDREIVSARWDGSPPSFWDRQTGQYLMTPPNIAPGNINAVEFSPDATRMATVAHNGAVLVWNIAPAHRERAIPNQITFLAGDLSNELVQQRISATQAIVIGRKESNRRLACSPDRDHFAIALADYSVRILSSHTGEECCKLVGHTGHVRMIAYSPDGNLIATVSLDDTCRIWDAHTGAQRHVVAGLPSKIAEIFFGPGGKRLFTKCGQAEATAIVWDVATGKELMRTEEPKGGFYHFVFSADGRYLLLGHRTIETMWDIDENRSLEKPIETKWWDPAPVGAEGRFFPTRYETSGKSWVVLVDREPNAAEAEARTMSTAPDAGWHLAEMNRAKELKDDFAEKFHSERFKALPVSDSPLQ